MADGESGTERRRDTDAADAGGLCAQLGIPAQRRGGAELVGETGLASRRNARGIRVILAAAEEGPSEARVEDLGEAHLHTVSEVVESGIPEEDGGGCHILGGDGRFWEEEPVERLCDRGLPGRLVVVALLIVPMQVEIVIHYAAVTGDGGKLFGPLVGRLEAGVGVKQAAGELVGEAYAPRVLLGRESRRRTAADGQSRRGKVNRREG